MATNIEMNILKADGNYEILYPKTLGSLVDGKVSSATSADSATTASSLNSTLAVSGGGTGQTTASGAIYNLLNGLSTRTSSNINNYPSDTYLGGYYGSSGYKIPIENLLTYFSNNIKMYVYNTRSNYTGNGQYELIISSPVTLSRVLYFYINAGTTPKLNSYSNRSFCDNLLCFPKIMDCFAWSYIVTGTDYLGGNNTSGQYTSLFMPSTNAVYYSYDSSNNVYIGDSYGMFTNQIPFFNKNGIEYTVEYVYI